MELILSLIWFAVVLGLILHAVGQRNALAPLRAAAAAPAQQAPVVAIIVPARDEESNIGPCLDSLLGQDYPALVVYVVDDESTDGTPQVVRRLAAGDERVKLLHAPPLPAGWKGKAHACWVGAQAVPPGIRWLCFLDADMRAEPPLIASALGSALAGDVALLSLAPRHELHSVAERLILPCGLYLLGFSQDLARIQAPDSGDAVATGQFMLLNRDAYDDVGGFAIVRSEICEDIELARALKRRGHRVVMQDGSALLRTRMYTGWSTLWPGIAKNLTDMLGGPARTLSLAMITVILVWAAVLIPLMDAVGCAGGRSGACAALVPAALASAAAFGLHIAGAAHFGIPLWYGLIFPVAYSVGALIALDSVRWRLVRRVRWKGRVYQ
jgi:chlorobactene glucosyltransferase